MLPLLLPFTFWAAGVGQVVASPPSVNRSSAMRLKSLFPAALFPFFAGVPAMGVRHCISAAPASVVPPVWPGVGFSAVCAWLVTVAVGHDEHPEPFVRRANFSR